MKTEAFSDLITLTQKQLGWLAHTKIEEMAKSLDSYGRVFPNPTGDIHLPILDPDKAMTVKQLIEKLSALDGDLKVYIRHDEGEMSDGGTWMDDVTDKDKYEVLDMESHVVIDVT